MGSYLYDHLNSANNKVKKVLHGMGKTPLEPDEVDKLNDIYKMISKIRIAHFKNIRERIR